VVKDCALLLYLRRFSPLNGENRRPGDIEQHLKPADILI